MVDVAVWMRNPIGGLDELEGSFESLRVGWLGARVGELRFGGEALRSGPPPTAEPSHVTPDEDRLWLRGVDIAFTKSDSFEYYRDRIHFIARLFSAELHILVPKHITSLKQLEGEKIANGIVGSASNVSASVAHKVRFPNLPLEDRRHQQRSRPSGLIFAR